MVDAFHYFFFINYLSVKVLNIPRWEFISIVVFKFQETLALNSNNMVKDLSHIICSCFVCAYILKLLYNVLISKLKPSCSYFLLLDINPNLFSMLFENDSVVTGVGSLSIITSIISLRCIGVNFSVGAFAYLKTNFVKSNTQNLV